MTIYLHIANVGHTTQRIQLPPHQNAMHIVPLSESKNLQAQLYAANPFYAKFKTVSVPPEKFPLQLFRLEICPVPIYLPLE